MSVYVSELKLHNGDDRPMCFMVASTLQELHEVASAAGVPEERFSGYDDSATTRPHYTLNSDERSSVLCMPDVWPVAFVNIGA